ncbi:hypothetical protein UAY_01902 [Enterococcus moraviensis ATCC BAA-383]|uniref:Uncharacterized protein n=1 Tax=Enterococcus moraviensis ATCC BAA-383 TaxID=1158609 RepID=R2SV58_9ENTE|nr:hypothetical protein [Enterococcus moraviensis]EOH99125.1 hypothetical protein UAY_01902 [Enterococcus moraviensis ATCC BAA-383]EOT72192.1 hypothetical protein I586_02000 [Enterococcus moraviensis ATCC BAA-383]OJG67376.1 hypothetical protein RV09_GL002592 [Enterococcus moraviensis]
MKQILGILSVIIVLGAVIFVFFGHQAPKETDNPTSEQTKETSTIIPSTTSETKTSTTTTTTTVD